MYDFQTKIAILKSCEATAYAICLTLLVDEAAACEAAKAALLQLFQDNALWHASEAERQAVVRRHCVAACVSRRRLAASVS